MERVYCRGEKKNTVIGIRADGNEKLGMGHLMRCLSIALALRESGFSVVFITVAEDGREILAGKGFEQLVLHSDYTHMEAEYEALQRIVRERELALLLVDSYQVTPGYLKKVREWVPVVCLEEEIREGYPADGIINYNIYAPDLSYSRQSGEKTHWYLGSLYAPLRPEFAQGAVPIRERARKVLITMGGSDACNISGQLLKKFLQRQEADFAGLEYEVVCGAFNPHREELTRLAAGNPRVHIRASVEDMAGLMKQCDIALSAAGSTMYELSALGVPTVCCYYVDNQRRIAEGFARRTKVVNAGDYTAAPEAVLEEMVQAAGKLLQSKTLRKETAESMQAVADGRGAKRLAEALEQDFLSEREENR